MSDPRTTIAGIGAILAAVAHIMTTGHLDFSATGDLAAVLAGVAGIFAKDA